MSKGWNGILTPDELLFCELYSAYGDVARAVRDAHVPVPVTRSAEGVGKDLLIRPSIKDYLTCITGGSEEIEKIIERLSAMRRESWRRGDTRMAKEIEMDVAKLKGFLIDRVDQRIENTQKLLVADMSTEDLKSTLQLLHSQKKLPANIKMLEDGSLEVIDVEFEEVECGVDKKSD